MITHYLTVPGLASSGPQHWQTIWEKQDPDHFHRVEQVNWDWPVKDEWVGRLQEEISLLTEPTVLIAHSLGCITVAHWAQEYSSPWVRGVLFVAPADADFSKRLAFVIGFAPIPHTKLPFKSIVVASTNDIYAKLERSKKFADDWGSEFVNLGKKGHINAVSGLGDWEEGKEILRRLTSTEKAAIG
jgi:predicted alpha/beta hydrolase family esterase